jgi:hypothetical protein
MPRARTKRSKLEPGIWQDDYGVSVIVTIAGKNFEERHPRGTMIAVLRQARRDLADRHKPHHPPTPPPAADAARTLCDRILAEIGRRARNTGGPNKSWLRLAVLASTDLEPTTLSRITRADLNLTAATVVVRGSYHRRPLPPRMMPLTPAALEAFTRFAAGDAFDECGVTNTRDLVNTWRMAVTKAQARWHDERPGVPWPLRDDDPFDLTRAIAAARAVDASK